MFGFSDFGGVLVVCLGICFVFVYFINFYVGYIVVQQYCMDFELGYDVCLYSVVVVFVIVVDIEVEVCCYEIVVDLCCVQMVFGVNGLIFIVE